MRYHKRNNPHTPPSITTHLYEELKQSKWKQYSRMINPLLDKTGLQFSDLERKGHYANLLLRNYYDGNVGLKILLKIPLYTTRVNMISIDFVGEVGDMDTVTLAGNLINNIHKINKNKLVECIQSIVIEDKL